MNKIVTLLVLSAALGFSGRQASAEDGRHFVLTDWNAETVTLSTVDDGEIVIVSLPATGAASISARIVEQAQMLADCEVRDIRTRGDRIEIMLKLGEANRDDGWNGCTAEIRGAGTLLVEFGFDIND